MCIRLRSHLADTRGSNSRPLLKERLENGEEEETEEDNDKLSARLIA